MLEPLQAALADIADNYRLATRLFPRVLGLIYLIAFLSLLPQLLPLIGSHGILPAAEYLPEVRQAVGASAWWNAPAVFWLGASDTALDAVCWLGILCGALALFGIVQRAALAFAFICYISFVSVGQAFLSYQWDLLLLEAGFLAIFLGWSPAVFLLGRWLLFRLMLLSGAVKILSGDVAWRSLTALRYHYETQPLPTPLAWYFHLLPDWFQSLSVAFVFFVELIVPFFFFGPRLFRLAAAGLTVLLQLLIILTGNYTFFNWLTIALCLFCLDDRFIARWLRLRVKVPQPSRFARDLARAVAVVLFVLSLLQLWSAFSRGLPRPAARLIGYISPFGIVNDYGLFAVMTTTRPEISVEGSDDGATWKPYVFAYKPGPVDRAPRWVAPHQPRLDWQMWFAALGDYQANPWFLAFALKLLQGSQPVLSLLEENPFPDAPPKYIRAVLYQYRFTDWETRRKTGAWWSRQEQGLYLQPISLR